MADYGSNNDRGYTLLLRVEETGTSTANNTSTVRVQLWLKNGYTTFGMYDCRASVSINGQTLSWSGRPDMYTAHSSLHLIDKTITVSHDSNGSKTISFSATFTGSGGWSPGTLNTGSQTLRLSDIPRSSSATVSGNMMGKVVTITIKRAATQIPNNTSGNGHLTLATIYGDKTIGSMTIPITLNLPTSVVPTLGSISVSESHATAKTILTSTSFAQLVSNPKVTFNQGAGVYGSIRIGRAKVSAYVTDSRGRQSARKEVEITLLEYFKPIFSFSAVRAGSSMNQVTVTRKLKIAPLTINSVQKNKATLTWEVVDLASGQKVTNAGGAANWTSTTEHTKTDFQAILGGTYDTTKSYNIIGKLADLFYATTFEFTVGPEKVVYGLSPSGMGIGKAWTRGVLDVDGSLPAYFDGEIYMNGRVLVGVSENESEFKSVNKSGGSKTHTLTVDEMPSHSHAQYVSANNGNQAIRRDYSSDGNSSLYPQGNNTGNTGGNKPHNNLQPYVTVYRWRRTA